MSDRQMRANAIRALSMDAVQRAQSGHPGMPMGMADLAEVLWYDHLTHNPGNPSWWNRDRFVLSNGHGSMLLYALLHLTGYNLTINDLKNFRQLHAKTPGHPEYGLTPGVETTTGPLGQGLASAVGMALAESHLRANFNRDGFPIIDHFTYVFVGDGCLMEGISHEACSLAGTLGLGKLIVFYDDNGISIDGKVQPWFNDDTPQRFKAYHWHVVDNVDGHDPKMIDQAIQAAKAEQDKPTLICCKTTIGFGSPNKAGSEKSHGAPLGVEEVKLSKQQLQWPHDAFVIPDDLKSDWDKKDDGAEAEAAWQTLFDAYQKQYPELAQRLQQRFSQEPSANWHATLQGAMQQITSEAATKATRQASQQVLDLLAAACPALIGGSADLTGSNLTRHQQSTSITPQDHRGNYIYFGVREFAMSAIANGLAVHGGFIPYIGTFLVFSDYARNAVRLAALMGCQTLFVYTHDSIGLGEDGPTHQPIEHLNMLRMTPKLDVWRPADTMETLVAWASALTSPHTPSAIALSRQAVPFLPRDEAQNQAIYFGGYILRDSEPPAELILMATGSEVHLAVEAWERLQARGIDVRVVSMPCVERFESQSIDYQQKVLPPQTTKRIIIEAGSTAYWARFVSHGKILGIDSFGESAPAKDLYQHFKLTVDHILTLATELLQENLMEKTHDN